MGYLLLLALSNGLDSHTSSFLRFKALNPSNVMYYQCISYSGAISSYHFCLGTVSYSLKKVGLTFDLWFFLFCLFFCFFIFFFCPFRQFHFPFSLSSIHICKLGVFPPKTALRAACAGRHLELLSSTSFRFFLRFSNRRERRPHILVSPLTSRSFTIAQADFQRSEFLNCYFSFWNSPTRSDFPKVINWRSADLCLAGATDYKSVISLLFRLFPITRWNTCFLEFLRNRFFQQSVIEDRQNLSWNFILLFLSFMAVPEKYDIYL